VSLRLCVGALVTCIVPRGSADIVEPLVVAENRPRSFRVDRPGVAPHWFRRRDEGRLWVRGHDTADAKAFMAAVLLNGGELP
jgi:hypothetical protein